MFKSFLDKIQPDVNLVGMCTYVGQIKTCMYTWAPSGEND